MHFPMDFFTNKERQKPFNERQMTYLNKLNEHNFIKPAICFHCEKAKSEKIAISKFGGDVPVLPGEENIAICPECGNQMEVLVQLYIPDLPQVLQRLFPYELQESLIVVFFCVENMPIEPQVIKSRIYSKEEIPKLITLPQIENPGIESSIFREFFPLLSLDESSNRVAETRDWDRTGRLFEAYHENFQMYGSYFLGYPNFIQEESTPGIGWTYLMNLDTDDNFSFMWGDAGTAQIYISEQAPYQIHLDWQCC